MIKNKILMNNIIDINNDILNLNNVKIKKINVEGKCIINLLNCNIMEIEINIKTKASLTINAFNIIDKTQTDIIIRVDYQSYCEFNHAYIVNNSYNLNVITNFLDQESSINVNVHGLNEVGKSNISIDGKISSGKINNVLNENIRAININGGTALIKPNMFIRTSKVIASHNATIGGINETELWYLMTKGINNLQAKNLICTGFLISIMKDYDFKIKVKELINGR